MTPIDEYLARVEPPKRKALERIRALAKKAVPEADEAISYGAIRVPLEAPIPVRTLRAVIGCRLQMIRADKKA